MKKLLVALFLLMPSAVFAQSTGTVVTDCTTGVGLAYSVGSTRPMTLLPTGKACVDAAVSVSFPTIGAAVPATGIYNGLNVAGTLRGWSGLSTGSIFPGAVAIVDGSGNQITSFGGAGGTASNFDAAFPTSGTAIGLSDGTNMKSWLTALIQTKTGVNGNNMGSVAPWLWNGTSFDAWTGTAALGANVQIKSGGVASGSFASGSIASGAYASGAFASGAAASGSWASGALVDITNVSTPITPATATATKALNLGMQYNSTQATFTNGQQGAVQGTARGALYVATGADVFTATLAAETTKVIGTVRIASGGVASGSYASGAFASGSIASGALASGSVASGAMVDLGAQADSACSTDNGTCSAIALIKRGNQNLTSYGSRPLDNSSVAINVSTATTTQLVAISASTVIYVTSFDVIAGGTGNITFVYGTGSSCGTGTTSLTGAYPLTAQAGISKGSGIGTILKVPAGNALCVTTSAAVQMSGSVSYQQF